MISNKQLNTLQSYGLYFYHLLKNNNIEKFEELENAIFNDNIFYPYFKKLASESNLNTEDFGFNVLSNIVLNYKNNSVLSKSLFFKNLSQTEKKDNFVKLLKEDISYIFEVLGSKNSGLVNNIGYIEEYINHQDSVNIKVDIEDFDNYTQIRFKTISQIRVLDFENRMEAYNFINPFYEDIKKIEFYFRRLRKYLYIRMHFRENYFVVFSTKHNPYKKFSINFDSIDNLVNFANQLYLVYASLEKISKSDRYFYVDFKEEENFITLIEKGITNNRDSKGLRKYEIINEVSFGSTQEIRKYMKGIYEEIYEFFI